MSQSIENVKSVSISPGNRKTGLIPSVSFPPVITCAANCPCAKKCYAVKVCRYSKEARAAYKRNLELLEQDKKEFWRQVNYAVSMTQFFRFFVSGDIPNHEFFADMVECAKQNGKTEILAFTKKYNIVNDYIMNGGTLPENLHVIFSEWGKEFTPCNPYNLPTAAVIFKGETAKDGWKICGGNCAECACAGVGCWELKNGETIAFYEH